MKLYFASSLGRAEKEFNEKLIKKIAALGIDVVCGSADQEENEKKLNEVDMFFVNLDSRIPCERSLIELGAVRAFRSRKDNPVFLVGFCTHNNFDMSLKKILNYIAPNEKCLIESLKEFIYNYK